MKTKIYTHEACLEHATSKDHPEQPERLQVLLDLFHDKKIFPDLDIVEAPYADREDLQLAHATHYVDYVNNSVPQFGTIQLNDSETEVSIGSNEAAYRAAGAVIKAVDDVLDGETETAFCAVRPPGHHAVFDRALGFCIFSNLFIGARHAQEKRNVAKIAIIDFDVHHGNGTDFLVRNADNIFFISSHQFPFYPGTGDPKYNLSQKILNLTLDEGADGTAFRTLYKDKAFPALHKFKPELIMISAGFDAHKDDPIGGLNLVEDDFKWVTKELKKIARKYCGGKIVSVLEGGYDLPALKNSVEQHIKALSA